MRSFTLINGLKSEYVSVDDRGLNYGDGVFETILIRNYKPVFLPQHLERLKRGCAVLQINYPNETDIVEDINSVIHEHKNGVLKIIITRGNAQPRGYRFTDSHKQTRVVRFYPDSEGGELDSGFALKFSNYPLTPSHFAGIKHLNRIEQIMASSELANSRFNEVICCDQDDNIVECASANIFLCMDNEIVTPALKQCGIKGIIRQWVLDKARELGIYVRETNVPKGQADECDEMFITNSIIGIKPVNRIESRMLQNGPVTLQLLENYRQDIAS